MVCGCTWSAHTIHIKCIGGFGTPTCDARSSNQPTKHLDQPVETCLPVPQPHLSPQTQLLAAGGALSNAIKNKGLVVVSRGFGVKRLDTGMGRALTMVAKSAYLHAQQSEWTTLMSSWHRHIAGAPVLGDGWTQSREVLRGRSVLLY